MYEEWAPLADPLILEKVLGCFLFQITFYIDNANTLHNNGTKALGNVYLHKSLLYEAS